MHLLYAILAAMGLGALHSLEPGHGKGIISAYLVSTNGKIKDAVLLGLVSAIAHTLSILTLAIIATSSVKAFVPEHLYYLIELGSGIAITCIGLRMIYQRVRPRIIVVGTIGHYHTDVCTHHGHHHHVHTDPAPNSLSRLISVGFFTGLIPCPSALAILLSAVATHHLSLGIGLVAAFSMGIAITMCTIGILVVHAQGSLKGLEHWRVIEALASVSSFIILCLGVLVIFESLRRV